jgi:SAM-dependent methyltransferase
VIGAGGRPGKWSVWKFNWLANHKLIRALESAREHATGALLDVGCGTKAFAPVLMGGASRGADGPGTPPVPTALTRYLGIDLPDSRFVDRGPRDRGPDVHGRGEALPFRDASFDTVLGLSMLTYFPEPAALLAEAHRVLKPGGVLILEFTQMAPLHDEPHDYFRFTRYGATWLLQSTGFEPVRLIAVGGLWARVGLSTIAALNRINRGPTRILTEVPVRLLYIGLQILFELMDRAFFSPREVLAHLVVAKRL